MEFISDRPLKKGAMIQYFWKSLKPLIKVEIEQHSQELNSFNKIVKQVVDAKPKATFRLRSYTRQTDRHYGQGSYPATTKFYTLGPSMKNPRAKKSKIHA